MLLTRFCSNKDSRGIPFIHRQYFGRIRYRSKVSIPVLAQIQTVNEVAVDMIERVWPSRGYSVLKV